MPFLRYYKNPLNRDDEMFCSELVAEGMVVLEGKTGCLKYHPTNIYPVTLFQDNLIWQPWNPRIVEEKMAQGRILVPGPSV